MSDSGPIRLHQALHGYADGHRLLAASVDLDRASRHAMLALSDMSGRSMVPGFEEYLTAYPVSGSPFFAVARTWYAPEMERPGCVWTHSILVPAGEIARIPDLSVVTAAFRRPSGRDSFGEYAVPLELPAIGTQRIGLGLARRGLLARVLRALYSTPAAVVLLPEDDPGSVEDLVTAVWSQQWARLRAAFTFCTGSIGGRSAGERAFDLQIVPESAVRSIRRDWPDAVAVERADETWPNEAEEWLVAAVQDLCDPSRSDLTRQLGVFDRFSAHRSDFQPAVELSLCPREAGREWKSIVELIRAIGERYPSPTDGTLLKDKAVGPDAPLPRALGLVHSDADILRALSAVDNGVAYSADRLQLASRCKRLSAEDPGEAGRLLLELLGEPSAGLRGQILAGLLAAMPRTVLPGLLQDRPASVIEAVRRDPVLAAAAQVWRAAPAHQDELLAGAVSSGKLDEDQVRQVVSAMLDAGARIRADTAIRFLGPNAVEALLGWHELHLGHGDARISAEWLRYLRRYQDRVIAWTTVAPRHRSLLAQVVQCLDPHSGTVQRAGADVWIRALSGSAPAGDRDLLWLSAFGLALALDLDTRSASDLAALTFEAVHTAEADGRLPIGAWDFFDATTPWLPLLRNWDRCERLRRALVRRAQQRGWAPLDVVRCTGRMESFRQLLQTCADYHPEGTRLLERMERERDVLRQNLPESWWRAARRYF